MSASFFEPNTLCVCLVCDDIGSPDGLKTRKLNAFQITQKGREFAKNQLQKLALDLGAFFELVNFNLCQLVYEKFAKYYRPRGHIAALDLEQARKNVIKAKDAYSQLKYQIKQVVLENDLMVEVNYKRQVEEVNNKIRQAELKKKYFLIKSPAKGSIKQIEIHRGEFLPGGQDIMDIVTKNNLHVVAFIDPKEAKNVHPGITVKMTFPDHFKAEGKVINVPNYADKTPLSFQNPMATRENKLVAIIKFTKELPKKYRVFGLPVDVDID